MLPADEIILGRPASEVTRDLPDRVSHQVLDWSRKTPEGIAVVEQGESWTYADLAEAVTDTRHWLEQQGFRPGDRLMLVCENSRAFVAVMLAASELDLWIAIISARLSDREIDLIRDDCEPRRVLYTWDVSDDCRNHAQRHGAERVQVSWLGHIGVSALYDSEPEPVSTSGRDQVFAMIYTSGTTGKPKGVMLTHHNIAYVARVSGGLRALSPADRVYGGLPMSHVLGLSSICLGILFAGGSLYLTNRFVPEQCLEMLARYQLTVMQGVPAMFAKLLETMQLQQLKAEDLALRYISVGGSPLDTDLKQAVQQVFGQTLHNGYGMTESSPTISQTRIDKPVSDCSTGQVLPGLEIRILDTNGEPVAPGGIGELWLRGPTIMKGYFRKPAATAEVVQSGWLNTQDLASLDPSNNSLTIVGRSKEMIIRSGFNVYPAEIEGVLNAHPKVTLSAVVGRQVGTDEEIVAYIQPVPGSDCLETEIVDYCRAQLTPYKCPQDIQFMDELPATPTGKILKGRLKAMTGEITR